MNVLVTGGAGYVGSAVSVELLREGHEVVVYDDLSAGHRDAVPAGATFIKSDVHEVGVLAEAMSSFKIDVVVHLAALSIVADSDRSPEAYYAQNLGGGLAVLKAMRAGGVHRLVFASSAAVYGDQDGGALGENDPTVPVNTYGETKLAFERALPRFLRAHGIRSTVLRLFNVAGATEYVKERHSPETHLIPLIFRFAREGRPFTVFGDDHPTPDGSAVRDYVHVEDVARAFVLSAVALHAGGSGDVYNVGAGGVGSSVFDIVEAASKVWGTPIQINVLPKRKGDPSSLVADVNRIKRGLGWTPRRRLKDILGTALVNEIAIR